MREARRQAGDERSPPLLESVTRDRQRPAAMVDDGSAELVQGPDARTVALRVGSPSDGPGEDRREAELLREPDVGVQKLGRHRGGHVGVEVRRGKAGGDRPLDLSPHLGLGGLGNEVPPQARHVTPEVAVPVDQPRRATDRRDRSPSAGVPLARQGQVHADVEGVIPGPCRRDLGKPGPGDHHRATGHEPSRRQIEEGHVRPVARAEVVVRDDRAPLGRVGNGGCTGCGCWSHLAVPIGRTRFGTRAGKTKADHDPS